MKILFDLRRVGFGNNGGSLTLIRSANTLSDLGHDVKVIDSGKNMHTWTTLKVPHLRPKNIDAIPNADVVIATGYKSVGATLQLPKRCGLKAHYIRGWETWNMPERAIINKVLKKPTLKIVNSIGLQRKLLKSGVRSSIIYPGYDTDIFYPTERKKSRQFVVLGGLLNKRHIRIKRHDWVIEASNRLKKECYAKLFMFGADSMSGTIIDNYVKQPDEKRKNNFYNHIDIWLAPTIQEGLHMPPAEAMLTECPVVGTDAPLSGMHDYLIHEQTGLVSKNNFDSFFNCVKQLVEDKDLRIEYGRQARSKIMEIGSREKNMKKMVELFERKL